MTTPPVSARQPPIAVPEQTDERAVFSKPHAAPAVRRFARELGVDLGKVKGSGNKERILESDVKTYVKRVLSGPGGAAAGDRSIPTLPEIDFGKFGAVEVRPLQRVQKISGAHLRRAWLNVPMVTYHDEADISELEALRQTLRGEAERRGVKLSVLVFLTKALAATLRCFPSFNASLSADGEALILKRYVHIGVAVDTSGGLVVPVLRDVDQKGIFALAEELAVLSSCARAGNLGPTEMQGGCMSISSLGGIGGSAFTPIVNAPEVAILGVTRSRMKPMWNGSAFAPRLMLPLDLSYDHRVIDGAEAARFLRHYVGLLEDLRRLVL